MKKTINQIIGDNIRKERKRQNLSQEELAELSGLHRNYIGAVERAENKIIVNTLAKIADALKIDIRDLFNL